MKGIILNFSFQTNSGVIAGNDGNRYSFAGPEWRGGEFPEQGMRVDFVPDGDAATGIHIDIAPAGAESMQGSASAPTPLTTSTPAPPVSDRINASAGAASAFALHWVTIGKAAAAEYTPQIVGIIKGIPTLYLIIAGAGAGVVAVALIALAVLSATGIIGGGNPQPISVLDLAPEDTATVIRLDVQKVLEEDLAEYVEIDDIIDLDDAGILPEELSELVIAVDQSGEEIIILQGSFDLDTVRDEFENQDGEEGTYRGYEIWENVDGGRTAALLKGYVVISHSEGETEGVLKNLYNETGSLARSDQDHVIKQILDRLDGGYVAYAAGRGSCQVSSCDGYGYAIVDYDAAVEEVKLEVALLFRSEYAAETAAADYDEIAEFLETHSDIDIEDTEARGAFVLGDAYDELR